MAVAICGILAAKITTEQTSRLGGDRRYMRKLLAIIDAKVNARIVDITLKFTLSALWNLSDEAPSTCEAFVAEGGLDIFMRVFETFKTEPDNQRASIEVKLLGFLNNLAEVSTLKPALVRTEILVEVCELLHSIHTDVSYFAGGIIAHVLSDGADSWPFSAPSWSVILRELEETVSQWQQPEQEMVAYRSFLPFFPLLDEKAEPAVQMWALWAWLHVCSLNCDRYSELLLKEGGDHVIITLMNSRTCDPRVVTLATNIMRIVSSKVGSIPTAGITSSLR
jgi:Zyg-11 family protein